MTEAEQSPRFWYLTPLSYRLTKKELEEIMEAMPDKYRGDRRVSPLTKSGMLSFINSARAKADAERHSPASQTKAPQDKYSFCSITADECNEWLRSLPPVVQV